MISPTLARALREEEWAEEDLLAFGCMAFAKKAEIERWKAAYERWRSACRATAAALNGQIVEDC